MTSFVQECPPHYTQCSTNGGVRFPFRVFVSLTVAPHRLAVLKDILPNVSLPCVTAIVLNLPDSYRGAQYDEQKLIELAKTFSKIYFNRFGEDLGPISKMLPTLKVADRQTDVIISIDDDTLYTSNIIIMLCQAHVKDPGCIISNIAGPNIWNLSMRNVLGFTGVLYPAELLNDAVVNTMLTYNSKWKQCRMHDDMTITMALKAHGVRIRPLENSEQPCQVSAGLNDPGALYKITGSYWKHPACAWRIWGLLK